MKINPVPVLVDGALYIGDNGRVLHGKCSGMSARYTGYDISGQEVHRATRAEVRTFDLVCEACNEGEKHGS